MAVLQPQTIERRNARINYPTSMFELFGGYVGLPISKRLQTASRTCAGGAGDEVPRGGWQCKRPDPEALNRTPDMYYMVHSLWYTVLSIWYMVRKHKALTTHAFWYHLCLGPENHHVRSFFLGGLAAIYQRRHVTRRWGLTTSL